MVNNWKIQRKEGRVNVRVPVEIELFDGDCQERHVLKTFAENISSHGFRFLLQCENGDNEGEEQVTDLPEDFHVGKEYEVNIRYGGKQLKGIIKVVWKNHNVCGVHFEEREKGWLIN